MVRVDRISTEVPQIDELVHFSISLVDLMIGVRIRAEISGNLVFSILTLGGFGVGRESLGAFAVIILAIFGDIPDITTIGSFYTSVVDKHYIPAAGVEEGVGGEVLLDRNHGGQ